METNKVGIYDGPIRAPYKLAPIARRGANLPPCEGSVGIHPLRNPLLRESMYPSRAQSTSDDSFQAHRPKWVYYGFLFLGLGTLLPWNFFITADPYWQYKFRNTTEDQNTNGDTTTLQHLFTPMQVILSTVVNFLFLIMNSLSSGLSSSRKKITYSLAAMIIFFSFTAAMAKVNSDSWQLGFFIATMVVIVLITAFGAIFQGGLFAVTGMFPEEYMCGVAAGQALGGIFSSIANIVALAMSADEVSSAFVYFLVAVVVMVITLVVFRYVSTTRYYMDQTTSCLQEDNELRLSKSANVVLRSHWEIFTSIWPTAVSVAVVFMVTLSVFPVMCVRVTSTSTNDVWAKTYFQPVVTFLLFNVCDFLGRKSAGWVAWPGHGNRLVHVFAWMRVVFIPLLMICNHDPNSSVPIIFPSDIAYIIIITLFGLSNGYVSTLCLMYAPKMVRSENSEKASGMMAAMMGLGLLLGSCLSFAFALIP